MTNIILEIENVSKSFFGIPALQDVSLALEKGQLLGLVGENGASKSTLMNILGGVIGADKGTVKFNGNIYTPACPADATCAGIAFIHQELNLFTNMSIVDNLFIDEFPKIKGLPLIGKGKARRKAKELLEAVDLNLPVDTPIEKLSPGERQLVEIAEALRRETQLIIFDEPTTSLTTKENQRLTDEVWVKEAARRGLNPNMLIEFVDGSKTMIEMAAVSNATGLIPDVRGMHGPKTSRDKLHETFALKEHGGVLNQAGVVEYGIGRVHPGVFLVVTTEHPRLRQALVYRDMGNGPYYTLFRPYHLCSIEVPLTCAMLAIRRKSNMVPLDKLISEVFAVAKQDLQPGDTLDGIGGSSFYGLIDRYEVAKEQNLLPIGLAKGAKVTRSVKKDTPIKYDDVQLKEPSTILDLRRLQDKWMRVEIEQHKLLNCIDSMQID